MMYVVPYRPNCHYADLHATMRRPPPLTTHVHLASLFLCLSHTVLSVVLDNSTKLESFLNQSEEWWQARSRGRRSISEGDMHLILDLHNKLRGQVHPPASNMEYMVSAQDTTPCTTAVPFRGGAKNCGVISDDELRSFWIRNVGLVSKGTSYS